MSDERDRQRSLATCRACGKVSTVNVRDDGAVVPIGRKTCQCGESDFHLLDGSDVSTRE